MSQIIKFIFGIKLYIFRAVSLSIIRSFSQYKEQCYMSYRFADSLRGGSGRNWFHPDPADLTDRGTVRNMQSFIPKRIREISASSWFYYKNL